MMEQGQYRTWVCFQCKYSHSFAGVNARCAAGERGKGYLHGETWREHARSLSRAGPGREMKSWGPGRLQSGEGEGGRGREREGEGGMRREVDEFGAAASGSMCGEMVSGMRS